MPAFSIALKVELTLMDVVLEVDKFDPRNQEQVDTLVTHWLENKDSAIIEAIEDVEVLYSRCLDDQPYYDPFSSQPPVNEDVERMRQYQQKVTETPEKEPQKAGILDEQGEPAEPYKALLQGSSPSAEEEKDDEVDDEIDWF